MQKLPLFLTSALLLGGAMQLRADEVKLTTALPVGETMQLALNADLKVELTWGNNDTQTIVSDGSLQSIPVKDAALTITSTAGKISSLYVQGNRLTALNLAAAPNVHTLLAADNELAELNLTGVTKLVRLDLQGNKLSALNVANQADLKEINVANNEIASGALTLASGARPTHYVTAGNALTSAATAGTLRNAKTVWVQNNALRTLNLTQSSDLRSLCASNNTLTTVTLIKMPELTDVWVDHNNLQRIDLSRGTPKLFSLAADHNNLSEVVWDDTRRRVCEYVYLNDNALFINSMPTLRSLTAYAIMPQADYEMSSDYYELNEEFDLSDLLRRNGWGVSNQSAMTYTLTDDANNELVKGTDFRESGRKFTFLTAHSGVRLTVTATTYPDATFKTTAFNVGITSGIDDATAPTALSVTAERGGLCVEAAKSVRLRVYNAAGACLVSRSLAAGTHRLPLPAGVYVVNGTKVIVP